MLRVLLAILLAVTATTFAMDNMHHVGLGLIVGGPVHVRLFFLLLMLRFRKRTRKSRFS